MSLVILLLRPYLITQLLELTAAYLWGIRSRKDFLIIILVNTITNPPLNAVLLLLGQRYPFYVGTGALTVMELLIWLLEGFLFRRYLKSVKHPFLFSLSLNAASFFGGKCVRRLIRWFGRGTAVPVRAAK